MYTNVSMARSADDVYHAIKNALIENRYVAGEYLREEQVARSLGVSRTPVREALRRLGAEGWLEAKPNYGVRVKAWSMQDAREIFEARLLIEPYLAGNAAARIGVMDIERLHVLAQQMADITHRPSTPESTERWFCANDDFHAIVTAAAGNARLDQSLKSMKETPLIKWTFDAYSDADRSRSASQHFEIVRALEQRNAAWAEAITRCHILAAQAAVLGRSATEDPAS
jgi:DNA-binding GntR family transcriptional regulator